MRGWSKERVIAYVCKRGWQYEVWQGSTMQGDRMPDGGSNIRQERINRLLQELRYEIERGMLQHEINEQLLFRFVVPLSKHFAEGVVLCEFHTRPVPRFESFAFMDEPLSPRLRVVERDGE